MSLSRTRRRSRRRTLLDTPLRQPLTFLSAPRNPIPHQEIRPVETPRVTLGSQRAGQGITPLSRVPLQAITGQPVTPQPLQRVSFAKQQVSLPPLDQPANPRSTSSTSHDASAPHAPFAPHPYGQRAPLASQAPAPHAPFEPLGIASANRSMSLQQTSLSTSRLKPLEPLADLPVSHFDPFADPSTPRFEPLDALAALPTAASSMPIDHSGVPASLLVETRLPLQGQQVDLHPISAVQQPVITRTSRVSTTHD